MPTKDKLDIEKLDLDEIIEEIKDEEEDTSESSQKEEKSKKEDEKEDKETKSSFLKNKKFIFYVIWLLLFIISVVFAFLAFKEKNKIIHVYSIPIKINHEVIYLTKKKKEEAILKKLYHSYNFNFQFAHEFNGVHTKKILTVQVTCLIKSKYEVNLTELYAYIKENILNDLKKLTANKFLEEIPDYKNKISKIIQENIVNAILKVCPDLKKEDILKTFNFSNFRIS